MALLAALQLREGHLPAWKTHVDSGAPGVTTNVSRNFPQNLEGKTKWRRWYLPKAFFKGYSIAGDGSLKVVSALRTKTKVDSGAPPAGRGGGRAQGVLIHSHLHLALDLLERHLAAQPVLQPQDLPL